MQKLFFILCFIVVCLLAKEFYAKESAHCTGASYTVFIDKFQHPFTVGSGCPAHSVFLNGKLLQACPNTKIDTVLCQKFLPQK